MPNVNYIGRTAPLTSKVAFYIFIQQIYVPNILNTVYTLRFFSIQNAVCFIMLTYLVPVLFTFYIQGVLKLIKIIPAPKGKCTCVILPHSTTMRKWIWLFVNGLECNSPIFSAVEFLKLSHADGENWNSMRKRNPISITLCPPEIPHGLESKPGFRGERSVTKGLSFY